ncbi:MAG: 4Fe-4S dicluster domain-containing protein [Deltaproteobacteria bacterium]|nr:MAG: 4Fe-4S dicluster domain-containing protein [Deltaproteobacteria bacterium]
MNRLYVAESGLTPTGAKADHRLPVRAADVALLARALAAAAGVAGVSAPPADQVPARWVQAVAHDLGRHRGRSLVVAGETQPAEVQVLAHLTNAALGNVGHTVAYVPAAEVRSEDQLGSLHVLVDDMAAGRVELLVVLGGDPAFNAPADLPFAEAMAKVPLRVHLSLYANDTAARSHWVVPAAHYLESWGDVRTFDGTVTIVQPLIAPLYAGKSAHELLAVLAEGPTRAGYDIVRARWQAERRGADFDDAWRSWLEAGIVPGTALATRYVLPRRAPAPARPGGERGLEVVFRPDPMVHDGRFAANAWLQELPRPVSRLTWDNTVQVAPTTAASLGVQTEDVVDVVFRGRTISAPVLVAPGQAERRGADFDDAWRSWLEAGIVPGTALATRYVLPRRAPAPARPGGERGLEVVFRPDPMVHDGRFAANAWLQELPRPVSRLTWDNTVQVAPTTAASLGVQTEDVVDVVFRGRTISAPVLVAPGQAEGSLTVHFGYGGRGPFREHGFNAYTIRPSDALWFGAGLEIRPTAERRALARTQHHQRMEGRDIVRASPIERYHASAEREPTGSAHARESLYPAWDYPGYRWGMAIDLSACVGCNACVVACQAENNIPVVGKTEVLRGREMHWLRIDTYFTGDPAAPDAYFMPVPCMHCENAPCEVVCPVEATVHGAEGLNEMVYNRCVGTRYCSNNCPYKVRRFNFFEYSRWNAESLKLLYNPDVTVRSRGVMEKCTYCVQRIVQTRIAAEKEGRRIRDGEVVTACQQACPAEAIVFGDLNDEASRVRLLKTERRNYSLLEELNTRPRTTYPTRSPASSSREGRDAVGSSASRSGSASSRCSWWRSRRCSPSASASGASTSRSPGALRSRTSCGGSASGTPAR